MLQLNGQRVLILGLGDTGLAMARWCAREGAAHIAVWDSREAPPQADRLRAEVPAAERLHGALGAHALEGVNLLLKSPGLSPLDAAIAPLLAQAAERGVRVAGELEVWLAALADWRARCHYAPKVIAITGTNGKTTTTALTGLLVEATGQRVAVAGNIGPNLLDTLAALIDEPVPEAAPAEEAAAAPGPAHPSPEAADAPTTVSIEANAPDEGDALAEGEGADDDASATVLIEPPPAAPKVDHRCAHWPTVWVLELSSFQLDGVQGFAPDAAAVLNLSQDHLDWHGSQAAYAAAKARIYGPTDVAPEAPAPTLWVINRDDAAVAALLPPPRLQKGGRGKPARELAWPVCQFGLDAPRAPGDFGRVQEGGITWLVRALPSDEPASGRSARGAREPAELHLQRLMPADALRIAGSHNQANALAALALATAIGCPLAPMLHALRDYAGEPHRVQWLGRLADVDIFDDSKGTNVGATVAALNGLGGERRGKLAVVLGGDGKGQDFAPLAAPLARHARAVATIGQDAAAIESVLSGASYPVQRHATLEAAVAWLLTQQAQAGDALLLSPACASMDMFRNYAHRADVFANAVRAVAEESGQVWEGGA